MKKSKEQNETAIDNSSNEREDGCRFFVGAKQ